MAVAGQQATRGGLPGRTLGAAAAASLAVVVYSYVQHQRTKVKAWKSMAALVSALSMGNLRSADTAEQSTGEADERERRLDADADHFVLGPPGTVPGEPGRSTARLDRVFLQQLRAVARIIVPSLASKEAGIIAMHAVFLVLRTWLSVVVAELDGKIVKHLVRGQGRLFLAGLLSWFAIAVPATYTNSMIRFLESKLALAFRTRLTEYVHDMYLDNNLSYYKMQSMGDSAASASHLITTDIARFCSRLASFLSNLGKPTLDTIIFNVQLVRGVGLGGTVGMFAMYMATASLLRAWTPPFGRMAATQARLEGDFRASHARVITNAEEIAFYRGEQHEAEQLRGSLHQLLAHARNVARRKIPHVVFEDMIIKYIWSAFGYLACAAPFFLQPGGGGGGGMRAQRFVTNKRILVNLSDAGGRLMYSIKEVMELAGHTERVYGLLSTLHALRRGEHTTGSVYEDIDGIRLTRVPVVAPGTGELLVRPLTWEVRRGEHWMVAGPNGVGKSSVLRVLSGLWPVVAGVVERPAPAEIIYVPQRPYLALGSLRDQVIYPHTHAQMLALGRTDEDLMEVLHAVHLAYLPAREGGFGARKEWKDVLSGGEKQRINLARLFYHLPRFAVLDECTSAVSADVEGLMYEHAKRLGITFVTISHRPALYKYHTFLLRLGAAHSSTTATGSRVSVAHTEGDSAWDSDAASSPAGTSVSSGVAWDVVRLSTAASSPSSSVSPPLAPVPLPVPLPVQSPLGPQPLRAGPSLASTSRIDIARETLADANRLEIEQLRGALAARVARRAELAARLGQVQRELLSGTA